MSLQFIVCSLSLFGTLIFESSTDSIGEVQIHKKQCGSVGFDWKCDGKWNVIYPDTDGTKHPIPDISHPSRYSLVENTNALRIEHVKQIDSGLYTCGIDDHILSAYLHVTGEEIYTWANPSSITAVTFQTVTMTCRIDGNPKTVKWLFKEKEIKMGVRFKWASPNLIGNYDLNISLVDPSVSGSFQCLPEARPTMTKAILTVEKISTIYNMRKVETQLGAQANLTCPDFPTAGSNNEKDFLWAYEDLTKVIGNDVNSLKPSDHYLEIGRVENTHAQIFYCVSIREHEIVNNAVLLQIVGCPEGYIEANNSRCYKGYPSNESRTFMDAERKCISDGGHLATPGRLPSGIFDQTQLSTIDVFINNSILQKNSWTWIGLDKIVPGDLKWSDGHSEQSSRKLTGYGGCAYIYKTGEKFIVNYRDCVSRQPFICEVPILDAWKSRQLQKKRCPDGWMYFYCGGFCYRKFSEYYNPNSVVAVKKCRRYGADIAMPKTWQDYRNVHMMMTADRGITDAAWVGLAVGRRLEFRDGTSVNYNLKQRIAAHKHFSSNAPCLAMTESGLKFYNCGEKLPFVCQTNQTELKSPCISPPILADDEVEHNIYKDVFPGSYPWMAQIYNIDTNTTVCGGVLISGTHVITAAACLSDKTTKPLKVFMVDDISVTFGMRKRDILEVYVHDNIAIVELTTSFYTGCPNLHSACLPDSKHYSKYKKKDARCVVTRWIRDGSRLQYCSVDMSRSTLTEVTIVLADCKPGSNISVIGALGSPLMCNYGRWDIVAILQGEHTFTSLEKYDSWIQKTMQVDRTDERIYRQITRRTQTAEFQCGKGRPPGLNITTAVLVRENTESCEGDVSADIQKKCDNQPNGYSCSFKVDNAFISKPGCDYKYLNMTYRCPEPRQKMFSAYKCGDGLFNFSCGMDIWSAEYDFKIDVRSATYGYHPLCKTTNSDCGTRFITSTIAARCNGKIECRLLVHPNLMGGPICPGKTKALFVRYQCWKDTIYLGLLADCKSVNGNICVKPSVILMMTSAAVLILLQ